jgi:prevent-host-death family protein
MRTINATEFKAKCLAILDEVSETGEVLTILKHGRPVAQLVPPAPQSADFPQMALEGTIEFLDDVVAPAVEAGEWEVERAGEDSP